MLISLLSILYETLFCKGKFCTKFYFVKIKLFKIQKDLNQQLIFKSSYQSFFQKSNIKQLFFFRAIKIHNLFKC